MLTRYGQRNLTWIDCISPTPAEMRALIQEFHIDPLLAEELLLPSYRPKVERRGDVIYAILHFPTLRGGHHPEHEIDFLIGKNFLITTRYETIDPLHSFAKSFDANLVLGRDGTSTHGGHLFVAMVGSLYAALSNECHVIGRRLRDIEEHIFGGEERRMVAQLSQAGRTIHDFRQALLSHEEMLKSLEPAAMRMFGQEFSFYVRSLVGAYERIERRLNNLYDSLTELRETNNSLLSTKQNEIMKNLTIMAFVTFPLTLISGIFSMDTHDTPLVGLPGDFWIVIGIMVLLASSFFVYFKKRDWL